MTFFCGVFRVFSTATNFRMLFRVSSVTAVLPCGSSLSSRSQSVLLSSKCCYSRVLQRSISYTTLPSLPFSTLSVFPLPSLNIVFLVSSIWPTFVNKTKPQDQQQILSTVQATRKSENYPSPPGMNVTNRKKSRGRGGGFHEHLNVPGRPWRSLASWKRNETWRELEGNWRWPACTPRWWHWWWSAITGITGLLT